MLQSPLHRSAFTHTPAPAPTHTYTHPHHATPPLPRAGLYLPTSDVDAVIMGSGCTDVPQGLKALATALARKNMAKNMQVCRGGVGGACRVPIQC